MISQTARQRSIELYSNEPYWPEKSDTVDQILKIIFTMCNTISRLQDPPSTFSGTVHRGHVSKIADFIRRHEPIEFILPAFPAKSSNPEKTLGPLPDYGEVLALQRLNQLCIEIGKIYSPGARLLICSDGRVFSDLVQVSDQAVDQYGQGIQRILTERRFEHLLTYNLDDVFPLNTSHDQMRALLVETHGVALDQVRDRVTKDDEFRQLFNGIHRFLFEDLLVLKPHLTRNKTRNLSKDLAYGVIQRSHAWSSLVQEKFPKAVRLSIHPQPGQSRKIGVRLLPSSSIWRTPWHSVALFDGSQYSLVPRKEAEEMGATLTDADGKYSYYVAQERTTPR